MERAILLMVTAVLVGAAAPSASARSPAPLMQEATVGQEARPPSSQEDPSEFTPAPLPDTEATAPILRTLGPTQTEFAPGIYRPGSTYRGDGYMPGSSVEGNEQRHVGAIPELNMKVPLE